MSEIHNGSCLVLMMFYSNNLLAFISRLCQDLLILKFLVGEGIIPFEAIEMSAIRLIIQPHKGILRIVVEIHLSINTILLISAYMFVNLCY